MGSTRPAPMSEPHVSSNSGERLVPLTCYRPNHSNQKQRALSGFRRGQPFLLPRSPARSLCGVSGRQRSRRWWLSFPISDVRYASASRSQRRAQLAKAPLLPPIYKPESGRCGRSASGRSGSSLPAREGPIGAHACRLDERLLCSKADIAKTQFIGRRRAASGHKSHQVDLPFVAGWSQAHRANSPTRQICAFWIHAKLSKPFRPEPKHRDANPLSRKSARDVAGLLRLLDQDHNVRHGAIALPGR